MRIEVVVHGVDALLETFGTMQQRQIPFAAKWAFAAAAKDGANAVRNSIRQKFGRSSSGGLAYLLRHVQEFGPNSKTAREFGGQGGYGVGIFPPTQKGNYAGWSRYRGSLLAMMERGGPTPGPKRFGGAGMGGTSDMGRYPIPIRRPGQPSPYPKSLYPINLGLSSRVGIDGRRSVGGGLRGKKRTFMVPIVNSPGNAMIFQRFGRGKGSDVMPLFWTQRNTRLPARNFFFAQARAAIEGRVVHHFKAAMAQALWGRGAGSFSGHRPQAYASRSSLGFGPRGRRGAQGPW